MNGKNSGELTSRERGSIAHNDADSDGERVERMQAQMGRRRFMAATAGTAAAVVAGSGVAAAQSASDINFSSDVVHAPRVEKDVTIAEHSDDMSSVLEYIDDGGELVSLADDGAALATRAESDEPHNPVTLRADKVAAAEYRDFPRGETYEDSDGDEQDLSALDAQHWTTDASSSAGSITVETVDGPNGEDSLRVAASGQGSGDVVVATFDDVEISSGLARKYIQLAAAIDALPSGATATLRLIDSADQTIEAVVDSGADETATGTIATATGPGQVYQEQLGEFSTELDDVVSVELEIADGDVDLTLAGFNLERESRWEYGTREIVNSDDELETETVREPSGEFSITELSSLPSVFADGAIMDVGVDVEFRAASLPSSMRRARWGDAGPYDYDHRLETLVGFDLPTAYDLTYGDGAAVDEVLFPDSRYNEVGFSREEELPTWEDVDDEKISFTDRTSTYESGTIGDDVEITPSVSADETLVVYADVLLTEENREAATASTGGGTGGPLSSGGGLLGSPLSIIMTALATVAAYVAHAKGMIPGLGN